MNCKPGDLAIVVRHDGWGLAGEVSKQLVGRVVKVLRLKPPANPLQCTASLIWQFENVVPVQFEGRTFDVDGCADSLLKPIRPSEDDDEMIRIAGKPHDQNVRPKETA